VTTLPTGEKLPEYDDGPADGVDVTKMVEWLRDRHRSGRAMASWTFNDDAATVRDVLAALQAVGDATLVKNETYRAMRRDGVDIERLTAHLANRGHADLLIEHDGNPVATIIAVATRLDEAAWG
jgi:hypothetical protein